jgi:mRNA interferase MazF
MRRGDLVVVALQGDNGKPRPAIVLQSDAFLNSYSVVLIPLTSDVLDAPGLRVTITPTRDNGLRLVSQAMLDRLGSARRDVVGQVIGRIDPPTLQKVEDAVSLLLGLA